VRTPMTSVIEVDGAKSQPVKPKNFGKQIL